MGTNYYIKSKDKKCHECGGTGYLDVHVGKSSGGWQFLFNPFKKSFKEWKEYILSNKDSLYDEYGDKVKPEEFFKLVEEKQEKDSTHYRENEPVNQYEFRDDKGYRICLSDYFR